jgi:hypothetical protein
MFGRFFDRQRSGRKIEARTINRPLDAIEAALKLRVAAPLEQAHIGATPLVRDAELRPFDARLTGGGTGGKYSWQAITGGTTAGSWVDVPGWTGSLTVDPAWEYNLNATLAAGTRVILKREPTSGELRFALYKCS